MNKDDTNFGDKINSNGFDKNPGNINRKGAPRKSFREFSDILKKEGYEPLKKQQYIDALEIIFNTNEERLHEIADDINQPWILRIMIIELRDKRFRQQALRDYRDYAFGKAKDNQETTSTITIEGNPFKMMRENKDVE